MASRRVRLAIPAIVAVTTAAACSDGTTMPEPHVVAIEHPTFARYIGDDADRVVNVAGEHFSAGVTADAGSPDESTPDGFFVEIQQPGDIVPIQLVNGTLLGPDRWIGEIPADEELLPGLYDVTVRNADGGKYILTAAFEMGYRATRLVLFSTTATEPGFGSANRVSALYKLETDTGEPGYRKESILPLVEVSSGDFAQILQPVDDISPGTYAQPTFTVVDSAAEVVQITATGIPADMTVQGFNFGATFAAGPPFVVRIVPANEVNIADDFVITEFRIEDQWGNVCKNHLEYTADFSTSICSGAAVTPDPLTIPANGGFAPITVTCGTTNDTFVDWLETTATGYTPGGTTIIGFD